MTICWQHAHPEQTLAAAFIDQANSRYQLQCHNYDDLYRWSITHSDDFWALVWDFCHVISQRRYECVSERASALRHRRWFSGAHLNFAENLLQRGNDDDTAIISFAENGADGFEQTLSRAALRQRVAALARFLREEGVVAGNVVAAILPNIPAAIVAMLATTSIGAVWTACSPDFGIEAICRRLEQVNPVMLFIVDGYVHDGITHRCGATARAVAGRISSIRRLIRVQHIGIADDNDGATDYSTVTAQTAAINYTPLPFDAPLFIVFSSGTTGAPKCIIHSVGGTLLQHLKEHQLHSDIRRGDTLCFYTNCAWMMWHWQMSALASEAAVVLFDGAPLQPQRDILLRLVDRYHITALGAGARYWRHLQQMRIRPASALPSLRTLFSTASPLTADTFDYIYTHIKADVQLSSISGGTDILSCFALGTPLRPVRRGELQCRGLGMAVNVYDNDGKSIVGQTGELVCENAFPSMPIGFVGDSNGCDYHDAYFNRFHNVWMHGDFAEITANDGCIIHGRSDTTLNPSGIRIGSGEIYEQVCKYDVVSDCVAVGQQMSDNERILLFVVLADGQQLTDHLIHAIKNTISVNTSERHVPAQIIAVDDIPRTRNGKISETAVRDVVNGRAVSNTQALANPDALAVIARAIGIRQ